jgi:uncharacterized protein (TIGR03067 family)
MTRILLLSILLIGATGSPAQTPAADPAALQGSWIAVSAGGKDLPAGTHVALIIIGDKYSEIHDGRPYGGGTVRVDPSKKPMWLDFVTTEGPDAGKTQLCLVEVGPAGDTATMALGVTGSGQRPAALTENQVSVVKLKPLPAALLGDWHGALETSSGATLRIVFALTNGPDGLASGTFTSVDQSNRSAPIAAVVVRGVRVTFIMPMVRGAFDGELKDGQLVGTWTQPAGSRPFVLKRTPAPETGQCCSEPHAGATATAVRRGHDSRPTRRGGPGCDILVERHRGAQTMML